MAFGWFSKSAGAEDKALAKAKKLADSGRWAEALTFYDEVLERDPGSDPAKEGSRVCREQLVSFNLEEAEAYRTVDPAKAREHVQLAVELAASQEDLRLRASRFMESLGRSAPDEPRVARPAPEPLFSRSCSCATPCAQPLEEAEDHSEIDVEDLAEFYLDSCEPEEREVLERLGDEFRAGFVLLQQGELGRARPLLEQAARACPEEPGGPYALGLLESLSGSGEAAARRFREAFALDSDFGPALRHLADTLRELGDRDQAVALLSSWTEAHPTDAEARLLLAACLLEKGDAVAAAEQAREAQRGTPETDHRPLLIQARALHAAGDAAAALGGLQSLLARKPDQLDALVLMAQLLLKEGGGSAERAAEAFKRCYRLDPDRGWWYLTQVAEAYWTRGWAEEARDVLRKAEEELPEDPQASQLWEAAWAKMGGVPET